MKDDSSSKPHSKAYSRRKFIGVCSAAMALLSASSRAVSAPLLAFERVLLVDELDKPIQAQHLEKEREYVFFYPYVSTPVFLLDLGKPTTAVDLRTESGQAYRWRGGIGPNRSIVAFCAICAHRMSHPTAAVSFIGYREQPVGFLDDHNQVMRRSSVIQCCSEHSIYDPAQGARVLSGPAPQPLAAIALDDTDGLIYASGVYGGVLYERFFENFGFRLGLEFGPERVQQKVTKTTLVKPMDDYTRQRIQC